MHLYLLNLTAFQTFNKLFVQLAVIYIINVFPNLCINYSLIIYGKQGTREKTSDDEEEIKRRRC